MKCINFLYNVFTRKNGEVGGLAADWWDSHPDWNYYCRTNVRYSKILNIWLGGGGKTEKEAVHKATQSVRLDAEQIMTMNFETGTTRFGPPEAKGVNTKQAIKNNRLTGYMSTGKIGDIWQVSERVLEGHKPLGMEKPEEAATKWAIRRFDRTYAWWAETLAAFDEINRTDGSRKTEWVDAFLAGIEWAQKNPAALVNWKRGKP